MTQPDRPPLSEYPDEMVDAIVEIGLTLYMNGFSTGVATLAVNFDCEHAVADKIATRFADRMMDDPTSLAATRQQVMDILNGVQGRTSQSIRISPPLARVDDSL